jgi:hypothetical protein
MAILDLKTNLKSLKYESGNAPFVTKDINNPPSNSGIASQITRRADDVVRVTKAILPTNSRFLQNQALLQQINFSRKVDGIKAAQGKTTAGAIIQQVKNTIVSTAKVAASTIAQTAAAGTGLHIVRGFETRSADGFMSGSRKAYGNEAMANGIVNYPGYSPKTFLSGSYPGKTITEDYGKSNKLTIENPYATLDTDNGNSSLNAVLVSGSGAPVSLSNRGALELSNFLNPQSRLNRPSPLKLQLLPADVEIARGQFTVGAPPINPLSTDTEGPASISAGDGVEGTPTLYAPTILRIRDFRKDRPNTISLDYSSDTINKEFRVGLGNKGYWKKPTDYTEPVFASVIDKLNATDLSVNQLDGTSTDESSVRDLIKFRFEVLVPGQKSVFLYFRALLTSFDDSYTGNWNNTNYLGRGDAVKIYEGFSREVALGFKIVATTRDEMKPLYKKMVYLASTTAPTYGEGGNFMKGTLVRLTVGSYLYEVPGVINSVKYTWQENFPWEIAMSNPEGKDDMQELPHMMDCSISFGVIHDFIPQTGLYHYITNPNPASPSKAFFNSGQQVI